MDYRESILKLLTPSHIEEICHRILPRGRRQGPNWRVGSIYGEEGQSLSIRLDGERAGLWRDFATNEGGNILDLVKLVYGKDTKQAIEWIDDRYGGYDNNLKNSFKKIHFNKKDYGVLDLWNKGIPIDGTMGERYFQGRGILKPIPSSIRFIYDLYHSPSKSNFRALLCSIQNQMGEIKGLLRIYLSVDGKSKSYYEPTKMTLGEMKGHAIRLGEVSSKLGICEGVETALSIRETGVPFPVWSAISAFNMSVMEIPKEVEEVILFPDGDKAGESAALKAAERFFNEGRTVRIVRPPQGKDFNDLLCEEGEVPNAS